MRLARGIQRAGRSLGRGGAAISAVAVPVARLIARLLGPRLAIISPAGWFAVALAAVALFTGYAFGWSEFTYVGFAILVALAVSVPFLFGGATYSVEVDLNPRRVVVGQKAFAQVFVTNVGARRVLPSRMELPIGAGLAEFGLPSLAPQAQHDDLFTVPTKRRAVIVAGPAMTVRGDPIGLLRRTIRWTEPVDLFVHPMTIPLAPSAAGLVRDLEGQVSKKLTNNDLSFHTLREYQPGDDARYIHWTSTARTGITMIRQFEETRRSQLTVVFSEDRRYYVDDDEFELAVSVMASIATQVIRDGTQIGVVTETRRLRTHTPSALLDDASRLALVADQTATPREFTRSATLKLPPPSVVLLIAGSRLNTADHRAIQLLFPADAAMIGFTISGGAAPSLGLVGGMQLATIGELRDLPKVLRQAGR
jgi:uncharacterized protein (DUF58 family)